MSLYEKKIKEKARRICIYPIFDADGVFDESVFFYLDSLANVAQRIIVVVIGNITADSMTQLRGHAKEIIIKDCVGFDAGAVKYCFAHCLSLSELNSYDELILANDTNFGPFIPFTEIFDDMNQCSCDFWGINYTNLNLQAHLVSDFRVFKKQTFAFVYNYILSAVDDKNTEKFYAEQDYEFRMHKIMLRNGFHFDSYIAARTPLFRYCRPYSALLDGSPFFKVRSFTFLKENPNEFLDALKFVKTNFNYDVSWIRKRIIRKYGVDIDCVKAVSNPMVKDDIPFAVNETELKTIVAKFDTVYIYGSGFYAKYLYYYYLEEFCNLVGFVTSDSYYKPNEFLFSKLIFPISQITDKDVLIIIAMSMENTQQVLPLLTEYRNVVNLWEPLASKQKNFAL